MSVPSDDRLQFLRFRVALCTVLLVVTFAASGPAQPTQPEGKTLGSTDYFDVVQYEGAARSVAPERVYTVPSVEVDLGDSAYNKSQRRGLWNRILGQFWKESRVGSFMVTVDNLKPLPIYTVIKDAQDDELNPVFGAWRVAPPRVMFPSDSLSISVGLDFSDTATSSIAKDALLAATAVTAVMGGGPAALTVAKIPASSVTAIDNFLGALASSRRKAAPTIAISGSQLTKDVRYEIVVYDAPKGQNNRQRVATVRLRFEQYPSLYFSSMAPTVDAPALNAILHRGFGGKPGADGSASIYQLLKDNDALYPMWLSGAYSDYLKFCQQLPNFLGKYGFSPADLTYQEFALLLGAQGGAKRPDPNSDICPDSATSAAMRNLNLPLLPSEIPPKPPAADPAVRRAELRKAFGAIATAVARRQGLTDLAAGSVLVRQSVLLVEDLPLNEDHARGGDEIEELVGKLPATAKLSNFDFNGEGDLSGTAILRISKTAPGAPNPVVVRYQVRVVLDKDYLVQRLTIDPLK